MCCTGVLLKIPHRGHGMPERFKVTKTAEAATDYAVSPDEEAARGHLLGDKVDGKWSIFLIYLA